jgi:hypothetical protein
MATPRKQQISLVNTPYYHCVARCVRRAFLCGNDDLSGQSYERRMKISWFMGHINESIARAANKEDNCTGHLSDKRAAFLLLALLRTVHAGFPAHGSSLSKPSL